MRAHQIMTRTVVTVAPETTIRDAADIMSAACRRLPVMDAGGSIGVSRRAISCVSGNGTQRKREPMADVHPWTGQEATSFVHEYGRKVSDVMTRDPLAVHRGYHARGNRADHGKEQRQAPAVIRGEALRRIVSRANLLQAVASSGAGNPDPTTNNDHIRRRIIDTLQNNDLVPTSASTSSYVTADRASERCHHRGKFAAGSNCRGRERGRREESSRPSVLGRNRVRHVLEVARKIPGLQKPARPRLAGTTAPAAEY